MTENISKGEKWKARVIALYLPQFHPVPENDKWWGTGFTEWTNVTKAKPLFPGHQQPRLPTELGFYDLRLPEAREAQAALAKEYGVEGFCYWHYWFGNGRRILERPFNEVLATGKPDFPFCLAWANHSWTQTWKGKSESILIEQTYPGTDDENAHFLAVLPAFRDHRYIRVDGKPIFVVYAPHELADPGGFIGHWQKLAVEHGLPGLYFVGMTHNFSDLPYAQFDALILNPPGDIINRFPSHLGVKIMRRLKRRHLGNRIDRLFKGRLARPLRFRYAQFVDFIASENVDDCRYLPCVLPNWDSTPRGATRGTVLEKSTPELFRRCLAIALSQVIARKPQ